MARNYNIHVRTLAQVPTLLRVEGSWPGSIALTAGWFRARARPWNEAVSDPMVRLERGGADFLHLVGRRLFELGAAEVYSPALYPGSTRVWRRAGFGDFASLDVMERPLPVAPPLPAPHDTVQLVSDPDWDEIIDIDRAAFEGFWGMSSLGLTEAYETNKTTALFVAKAGISAAGYAIVGSQWGIGYLHRIAVRPEESGRGVGTRLVAAAVGWGAGTGSKSMVLNVRRENSRARRLYLRQGFSDTDTSLQVLRLNGA